jgi:hypothetical protein
MARPSESVLVPLAVALVGAVALGAFNYSRYRDARDLAATHAEVAAAEVAAAEGVREEAAAGVSRREEELARKVASLEAALAASRRANDELNAAHGGARDSVTALTKKVDGVNEQTVRLQATRDAELRELDAIRKRNGALEAERLQLLADRERAEAARIAAEGDNKQLRDRYEGKGKSATLVGTVEGPRGTVTGLDPAGADRVTISIGLDAGLTRGVELDVYRTGGRAVLLGTAVVEEVGAKSATARFKPAGGRRFAELTADERPRVGDVVAKVSAERTGGR